MLQQGGAPDAPLRIGRTARGRWLRRGRHRWFDSAPAV